MNELNDLNKKHAVVITEKLYRYIIAQGNYGEEFTQILERVIKEKGEAHIRRLVSEVDQY